MKVKADFLSVVRVILLSTLISFTTSQIVYSENYVLFLAGQSNALGFGDSLEITPPYDRNLPNVFLWSSPLGFFTGVYSYALDARQFGPEVGLSYWLSVNYPHHNFYIIKYGLEDTTLGVGGLSNGTWDPDSDDQYAVFRDQVVEGLSWLQTAGIPYTVGAFFWMQGESDTHDYNHPMGVDYQKNLTQFIAKVRSDYDVADLPFIFGRVAESYGERALIVYGIKALYLDDVRLAQASVDEADVNAYMVNTDDLSFNGDGIHYDALGQLKLGERFANEFIAHRELLVYEGFGTQSLGFSGNWIGNTGIPNSGNGLTFGSMKVEGDAALAGWLDTSRYLSNSIDLTSGETYVSILMNYYSYAGSQEDPGNLASVILNKGEGAKSIYYGIPYTLTEPMYYAVQMGADPWYGNFGLGTIEVGATVMFVSKITYNEDSLFVENWLYNQGDSIDPMQPSGQGRAQTYDSFNIPATEGDFDLSSIGLWSVNANVAFDEIRIAKSWKGAVNASGNLPFVIGCDQDDTDKLYDWAEIFLPEFFYPAGMESFEVEGFRLRYYQDTGNYLGCRDGMVYVYGDVFGGLLAVDTLSNLIYLLDLDS